MLKLKSSISLLAILVLATPVLAQDDAKDQPLLPELLSAQKIFVQQTLIDPRIVSKFRSEIAKWDHYEVVTSADDADLVAMLSAEVQYTQTVTDSEATADDGGDETSRGSDAGIRPLGTVRTLDDVHLTISTPDGKEIWTDAVPVTGMSGGAAKRLVKRLRNRIEDEA